MPFGLCESKPWDNIGEAAAHEALTGHVVQELKPDSRLIPREAKQSEEQKQK